MKLTYWTPIDRSRPSWDFSASMSALLAPGSTRSVVGSPVMRTNRKIVSDSRNSDSSAYPIRLRMNFFMAVPLVSHPSSADVESRRHTSGSAAKLADYRPTARSVNNRGGLRVARSLEGCYGPAGMAQDVTLTRDGAVATITLNRPERRNALSDPLLTALAAVLTELRDDATARVVVVTGAPPAFSAGADAGLKSSMSAEERRQVFANRKSQFRRLFERVTTLLEGLEQPTIAMVNGHAIGG